MFCVFLGAKSKQSFEDDQSKRSYSLDGDSLVTHGGAPLQKSKSKSAWSKVKGMVKSNRGSLKSRSRTSQLSTEGCSRDASPCGSLDITNIDASIYATIRRESALNESPFEFQVNIERNDSFSSSQTSPGARNPTPTFTLTAPGGSDSGTHSPSFGSSEEGLRTQFHRSSRKGRHIPEIESLPEGIPLAMTQRSTTKRAPPSPIHIKHDSSDAELHELLSSSAREQTSQRGPRTMSMPNSPLKTYEFFTDAGELTPNFKSSSVTNASFHFIESAEASSNDHSESNTPQRRLSDKAKNILKQKQEIKKNEAELQKRLKQEFQAKQIEWEKLRLALHGSSSPEESISLSPKMISLPSQVLSDKNLPADFKKKLDEWLAKVSSLSKDP